MAMEVLSDKDREIDNLLQTADDLVAQLRVSVGQAAARLRPPAEEGDDDG